MSFSTIRSSIPRHPISIHSRQQHVAVLDAPGRGRLASGTRLFRDWMDGLLMERSDDAGRTLDRSQGCGRGTIGLHWDCNIFLVLETWRPLLLCLTPAYRNREEMTTRLTLLAARTSSLATSTRRLRERNRVLCF